MGFLIYVAVLAVLLLYPSWRIFQRAGLHPGFSLIVVVPVVGLPVAMAILAFLPWPNGSKGTSS